VPAAASQRLIAGATHGAATGSAAAIPGVDPAAIHHAVGTSFVTGMHAALLLAGLALLAAAALSYAFVRPEAAPVGEPHELAVVAA